MQVAWVSQHQVRMEAEPAAATAPPLPPWLGNPRGTVRKIEIFVVAAVVLLFVQLILGFFRRRSSNIIFQGGVWLAYVLSFPLITYTLGMMQSSPVKSPMYPVWATCLFLVAGCTNSMVAYNLDDNKQWMRHLFVLLQCYFYAGMSFQLLFPIHLGFQYYVDQLRHPFNMDMYKMPFQPIAIPCDILVLLIFLTNLLTVIACWMVNWSDPSKVVADYMRDQVDSRDQPHRVEYDPIRMHGYKYLVLWHGYSLTTHGATDANYRNMLSEDVVTIDKIWEQQFVGSDGGSQSQWKNVCLSFSLFHLLKRRFFGMKCYEAGLPETRDFVLRGLLSENVNDYARAFRVIDVELGFLHDFFFTRYAAIYETECAFVVTFIPKIIFTFLLGLLVPLYSLHLETKSPVVAVEINRNDTITTIFILGALFTADIFQAILYVASDWALVSLACRYVRSGSWQAIKSSLLYTVIWILGKRSLWENWQNKIGQDSIIEGCRRWYKSPVYVLDPKRLFSCFETSLFLFVLSKPFFLPVEYMWKFSTWRQRLRPVGLPDIVKREITSSLMSSCSGGGGRVTLTNGEASLKRNGVLAQFSWTINREDWNQTDIMLIWHIATSYCGVVLPQMTETSLNSDQEYREVATKLSRYSAYLMASLPELLPDNPADTKFTFTKVMEEAIAALYPEHLSPMRQRDQEQIRLARRALMTVKERLLEAIDGSRSDQENATIFFKGLELGRELESIQDSVLPWKVMAEFWAETIVYIAPSDNVSGHIQQLANGGEFLTHVWALLSHAGILTRHQE